MRRSVRAGWLASHAGKRQVMAVASAAVLCVGAAGCAATSNSTVTATGNTLVIYVSVPADLANSVSAQDVLAAEQLAFSQQGSQIGSFKIRMVKVTADKVSDNARSAIQNKSSIAYLGEIPPGLSADSLGITNAQDLLQVTPTDTALELTQATAAVPGSPDKYYESLKNYGRTFARVVPTTEFEAQAQVQEMQSVGVKELYVNSDGSAYGASVALAVKNKAAAAGITVAKGTSGADAMFYGATSDGAAVHAFNAALSSTPSLKLFAPSAVDDPTFAAGLSSSAHGVYVSSPGFLPSDLPPEGRQFVTAFTAAYHHVPSLEAVFGYEAMKAVFYALTKAGSAANNRGTVVREFFGIRDRSSALGTYSINANGDTNIGPFVFSRLRAGKLVPFKSLQVQG
jgi:branched-chain amino acid transport system substrate-binding protein